MKLKKIVCIYIPHIFTEAEYHKTPHKRPIIISSGYYEKSIILDIDPSLERYSFTKGRYLHSLTNIINEKKVDICPIDYDYMDTVKQKIIIFLDNFSPVVETEGYSRYYIDLTGTQRLFGRTIDAVTKIIKRLKEKYAFSAQAGIGRNLLIATTASVLAGKNGVYEIVPLSERLFIQQLPLSLIPLFPASIKRLLSMDYNITKISDLFKLSKDEIRPIAKAHTKTLYNLSRGISRDFLIYEPNKKELKVEIIPEAESNDDSIRKKVSDTLFETSLELYKRQLIPGIIHLSITYHDSYQLKYRIKIRNSFIRNQNGLYNTVEPYLTKALKRRTHIKIISFRLVEFRKTARQLWLFPGFSDNNNLSDAITSIKKRYGKKLIGYGG